MRNFFIIYKECIKTALARAMTYRLNFLLTLLITLGFNILFPLVTILIYRAGASFPGWDFYEVLLLQSIYTLSLGFACIMFADVMWATMQHIREGSFEVVLLKPLNPLFFLIVTNFDPGSAGLIIGGGFMFVFSLVHTGIASIAVIPQFLLLFAAGFAVMAGLQLLMAATSFKWVGNSRIPEIFDSVMTFGKYPIAIFPKVIQGLATFVIPVAMVGFFPASALLGRLDIFTPPYTALIAVIPCFLFLLLGVWLYIANVKHYDGVGG